MRAISLEDIAGAAAAHASIGTTKNKTKKNRKNLLQYSMMPSQDRRKKCPETPKNAQRA
jgi:hypothetical protein